MIPDAVSYKLMVRGKVQGVFFRDSVKNRAQELELKGWVRNKSDGSVEILAVGTKYAVEKMVQFCREGPGSAQVLEVRAEKYPTTESFPDFRIRF